MAFPPGDITVLDAFGRADGPVSDGDGAELWDTIGRDGAATKLAIVGGQVHPTSEGGGVTLEDEDDFIRIITIKGTGAGFGPSFGFRLTDLGASVNGYIWNLPGTSWTLYRLDDGVFNEVDTVNVDNSLGVDLRLGFKSVGDTHEIYVGTLSSFPDEPVASFTDATYAGPGRFSLEGSNSNWHFDDYTAADLTAPTEPLTIIVDPDHADASDGHTRTQAANAATPMRTVQAACNLARATPEWADTVLVKVCTTEVLDAIGPDPFMQPQLDHRSTNRAPDAPGWTFGDNAGNLPILVKGDVALAGREDVNTETLPKINRIGVRGLTNWIFEGLQVGYDVGGGDDFATLSLFERVTDVTFRRCLFTGGLGTAQFWTGEFNVDQCVVHSPLPPPGASGGLHNGAGLRMEQAPGEGLGLGIGQITVTDSEFSNIQGDDGLTVGGLYGDPEFEEIDDLFDMLVRGCLFWNVTEGQPQFHTDCIQLLQVRRAEIDACVFIGSSIALIASDFRNGLIRFTRNLTVGINSPVQIQGTDEVEIIHNTFFHVQAPRDATLLFFSREILPAKPLLTCVNNIIGGFFMRDMSIAAYFRTGSVIENNLVLSNPGLVTAFGTNLPGIPEFGETARMADVPTETVTVGTVEPTWELATTPTASPGIGQGQTTDVTHDRLGRAYADPPDVGCHQSDPGTEVVPAPRAPFVFNRSPTPNAGGVNGATAHIAFDFYPVPGTAMDEATVDTASVRVFAPSNFALTGTTVELGALDGEGFQPVTITFPAALRGLVVFRVRIDPAVADDDGNELEVADEWTFTTGGASPYEPGGGGVAPPQTLPTGDYKPWTTRRALA